VRLRRIRGRLSPARDDSRSAAPRRPRVAVAAGTARAAIVLLTGAGAAIPIINSTVRAARAGWMPAGDDGIIATRGWDVLTTHAPLVGQYSEAGLVVHGQVVHSPGPMLYWLLALPAHYGSVASLAVALGTLNSLCVLGCVWLARRRGGYPLMLAAAAAIALMCQSLPTESLHDIWNPAAGLFPFLLLLFTGWSIACGEHRLLPLAALLASFVIQTHLMYLAPSAVVLAVAVGGLLVRALARWRARRHVSASVDARGRSRVWPWALVSLAVLAACWAAPLKQQLSESPGNLTLIVHSVEHRGHTLGDEVGWRAVVRSIGERPWWLYVPASEWERKRDVLEGLTGAQQDSAIALLAALALVALVGALRRRPDVSAGALIALGLCGAMLAQVASNPSSQLLRETLGYTLWWGSELGLWVWLVLAWSIWLVLVWLARRPAGRLAAALGSRAWLPAKRRLAVALVLLAGSAGVALVGEAVARTAKPDSHVYEYRPIATLGRALERLVPTGRTIDYRLGPLDLGTQPMEPPLRFLLVRHGDRVLADGSFPRLGSYYELDHRPYQWIVYLRDGTRAVAHMTLAARVRFRDPWGTDVLSAWVERVGVSRTRRRLGARAKRHGPMLTPASRHA
jgi:hypothetical protein